MYRVLSAFFLAVIVVIPTYAVELKDFYSASVPVADRSKATFEQGLRDALVQVLVKTSARPAEIIRKEPRLALDLSQGEQFAEQFSFTQRTIVDEASGLSREQLFLKASFPEKTILDLLQKGGLRLWPNNRPQALVWPVVKNLGVARFALTDAAEDQLILERLQLEASKHGIPVQFPTLKNGQQPSLNQFWLWNRQALQRESAPYETDAIITLRMARTGDGRILGGWQVLHGGTAISVDLNADNMDSFIQQGFDWLAQQWAKQFAIKIFHTDNETLLIVNGIDQQSKYEALLRYVESIDVVDQVYVLEMKQQQIQLAVSLKSQTQHFRKIIERGSQLQRSPSLETGQYQEQYIWTGH